MARVNDGGPLIGRKRELELLLDAVDSAAQGQPGVVLVAGEAGIGKSRLVRAALDGGSASATVQCVDLGETGLPHLTVIDLVRAVGGPAELEDPSPGADDSTRWQYFDAVARQLAGHAREHAPLVVVVEDLQWLDASSAEFLRFWLGRLTSEPLVVVATVRTDGLTVRPNARRLVGDLARLPWARRVDLLPLAVEEVGALLKTNEPALAEDVHRRTGGNPFYVLAVADRIGDEGSLPPALTDLLLARLDPLPDGAKLVARAASVVPRTVPDRVLRMVAELSSNEVDEALGVLVAEGLISPVGDGYAFTHDLLRAAIRDDLLPGVRARLHAAHASALETVGAGAAEIAHHHREAGDGPQALLWSVRAAEEAMRVLAVEEADQQWTRVLTDWAGDEVDGITHAAALTRAARAAGLAGDPVRAQALARQAVVRSDAAGQPRDAVEARAELVRQLLAADLTDLVVVPAEGAVALAADLDPQTRALAQLMLARSLLAARRADDAAPEARRALAQARDAGLGALEVEALTVAAFVAEVQGDRHAAAEQLGTALLLARDRGALAAELRAHFVLASMHYYNGDVAGALPVLRTAMSRVAETGLRWSDSGVEIRLLQAVALFAHGDLDASLEVAEVDLRAPDVAAARLGAIGCYAAVARGLPDVATRLDGLRTRWDLEPQVALVAGGCEADHLTWSGEPAAAVDVAERAQEQLDAVAGEGMYGGLWLSALGLAALADLALDGRLRRDEAAVREAVARGDGLLERVDRILQFGRGRPGELGPEGRAWHARAIAEHARLLGEAAVKEWQDAVAAFGYGHRYEEARCRWRLTEALLASGDRPSAAAQFQLAQKAAEDMGAGPLKRALEVTGLRGGLTQRTADAVLTARERDVLALVAEGLTNREIGSRLFISEKTVSVHLSNTMAKLNASSRTEAVTVAHRRGLLDVLG